MSAFQVFHRKLSGLNFHSGLRTSIFVLTAAFAFSSAAQAAVGEKVQSSSPTLFGKGVETFILQDSKGKTPEFRVLDGGGTEQALALGVIALLNAQPQVEPKIPARDYVDLKLQELKLEPESKTSKRLLMTLKLSGYDVEFIQTVDRQKFESGAPIEIAFPHKDKTVAMFHVVSSGVLKMKYDAKSGTLVLNDVRAKLNYDSPLGDSGTESIQFQGKGLRKLD